MGEKKLKIVIDDLSGAEIAAFLEEHIRDMKSVSSPESKHALDLEGLRSPDITFWTVYEDDRIAGCGAIKELSQTHGEIKSMRTLALKRGKGIASTLLQFIIETAIDRGYKLLSLETGSMTFFAPARQLYMKHGFTCCSPFADYSEDPNSVFMELALK